MAKDLKEILKDRLDVPGLLGDLMDEVAKPALDKAVASTDNTIDDALMLALYPALSAALKDEAQKIWDKLLKEDEAVQPGVQPE